MPTTLTEKQFHQGIAELTARDSDLAKVILRWGTPPFWTHLPGFPGIVLDILAQQVSLESANAVFIKLENIIGTPSPEKFLLLDKDTLRALGFSHQKASYVRGLAADIVAGTLNFEKIDSMNNDQIRKVLMEVRGIGAWTADTYILFSLRRADVWPSGDLALENSIQELKGLAALPGSEEADRIADRWSPWRAVAARILWHSYLCERGRNQI